MSPLLHLRAAWLASRCMVATVIIPRDLRNVTWAAWNAEFERRARCITLLAAELQVRRMRDKAPLN